MSEATLVRHCPRCKASPPLVIAYGVLGEDVCAACRGRLLPPEGVERVVIEEHGISAATLREMLPLFASRARIVCPACNTKLSPCQVRGVLLDLCTGCGAAWLDAGELKKLGEGRYDEVTPSAAEPTPVPAPETPVAESTPAGAERATVFLHSLDPLDKNRVAAAFATCPGLTEQDALALARHNNGVVVDGVPLATARAVADALTKQGVPASAAPDSYTTLPFAVTLNALLVGGAHVALGRDEGAIKLPFSEIAVIVAGVCRRSALRSNQGGRDQAGVVNARDLDFNVVESEEPVVELLTRAPVRRYRVPLSTLIFGERGRGRDRNEVFAEDISALAAALVTDGNTGIGRGPQACMAGGPLPRYRSPRDLEREEAWLLWRHFGPGHDATPRA